MLEQQGDQNEDFSLVLGGPLYQLSLRSGLIRPPFGKLGWRIAVITALTWLPLSLLTNKDGRFVGGVGLPFLYDLAAQARLLVALPMLVLAEYGPFVWRATLALRPDTWVATITASGMVPGPLCVFLPRLMEARHAVTFGTETIVSFLITIALPLAPLALTMFSLEELLARLVKVVL